MPAIMHPKHGMDSSHPVKWLNLLLVLMGVALALLLFPSAGTGS